MSAGTRRQLLTTDILNVMDKVSFLIMYQRKIKYIKNTLPNEFIIHIVSPSNLVI